MDVIKTHIQADPGYQKRSAWQTGRMVWEQAGLKSLLTKGLYARLLNTVPASVLMITAYETAKRMAIKQ
jgi:hypothetical protein